VKPANSDFWSDEQIASMRLGGNEGFIRFMKLYGMQSYPVAEKYRSEACRFYRQKLNAIVHHVALDL
jgi:hypothetical protein